MYAPSSGYAMTQYPGGVPVAVPVQAGGGMVPVQDVTPGPQGSQPQMVVVPASGMVGDQPQFAQVATSGAMATVYQPQMRPTYGRGGYAKLENEEVRVLSQTFGRDLIEVNVMPGCNRHFHNQYWCNSE